MKTKRITKDDKEPWLLLQRMESLMRSLGCHSALMFFIDSEGRAHFIWKSKDAESNKRLKKIVEMIENNQLW